MYTTPTLICELTNSPASPDGITPFAPLVTAKVIENNTILVRSILFVDKNATSVTFPSTVTINRETIPNPSVSATGNTLIYYFTYTLPELTPKDYNTWYTEQSYLFNPEANPITDVEVYLLDTDPVTSRGTRTTVQQS